MKVLILILLSLSILSAPSLTFAQTKNVDQKQMEKDLEKTRKELGITKDTAKVVKVVADVLKFVAPGKGVNNVSKTMGTISESAKAGEKLIKKIQDADEEEQPKLVKKQQTTLEMYIKAALNPLGELERIEAEIRAVEIPMLDCSEKGICVTLDQLLKDKLQAQATSYRQYQGFQASLTKLKELESLFSEMSVRAAGANKALKALRDGWEKATAAGCGILGSYCGLKWLEADELANKCNGIKSAAEAKLRDVRRALKEEQQRFDTWKGNMKDLFGIDVTKSAS